MLLMDTFFQQGVCMNDVTLNVVQLAGFWRIREGNETQLMEAVATIGPVAAGMDASQRSFQFYSSGKLKIRNRNELGRRV